MRLQVRFLGDPSGQFTEALDVSFDSAAIFGNNRSKRYALLVENGKVKDAFVEPDNIGVNGEFSDDSRSITEAVADECFSLGGREGPGLDRGVDGRVYTGCSHVFIYLATILYLPSKHRNARTLSFLCITSDFGLAY